MRIAPQCQTSLLLRGELKQQLEIHKHLQANAKINVLSIKAVFINIWIIPFGCPHWYRMYRLCNVILSSFCAFIMTLLWVAALLDAPSISVFVFVNLYLCICLCESVFVYLSLCFCESVVVYLLWCLPAAGSLRSLMWSMNISGVRLFRSPMRMVCAFFSSFQLCQKLRKS